METKEIILRIDAGTMAILEQEMKNKRNSGVANSIGDRFLIRLLESLSHNTKALLFKIEKNKLIVRNYTSESYDNHRQTGTENGETSRAST
jgi:hypothetical protein